MTSDNYIFAQAPGNATALTIEPISSGAINGPTQPPQSSLVTGVQITVPFLERRILSSQSTTPLDPTLIYSNSGDPGLW